MVVKLHDDHPSKSNLPFEGQGLEVPSKGGITLFVLPAVSGSSIMDTSRIAAVLLLTAVAGPVQGSDWTRFRGPNGSGVSLDAQTPPTSWSDGENLKWKTELPGPGLSSPIVVGDRVVVTCWSGYAVDRDNPGFIDNLKRNVICLNRANGSVVWKNKLDSVLPEESFRGMFAENGYASHSPATDGERVYAFFGKTGVSAFDLNSGDQLWQKSVGEGREQKGWGSASSPIAHNGLIIVPAFIEGDALVAFDGKTGDIAWEQKSPGYRSNWSTPVLVEADGRTDLVIAMPGEVWGMNPATGGLRWYCIVPGSDSARASVVADGDVVVAMAGGRGASSSVAVRAGGKGEVEPLWVGRDNSSTSTPVIHDGRMYIVKDKVATVVDMQTGDRVFQARLTGSGSGSSSRGFGGRGRGGPGGQDYSSPVIAGGHLYYASRGGDVFVVALGEKPMQVARNRFESDDAEFNATPAISDGELFIRSSRAIYCVAGE